MVGINSDYFKELVTSNIFQFWPGYKLKAQRLEVIVLIKLSLYFYLFKSVLKKY